jgi:hypothetical protein
MCPPLLVVAIVTVAALAVPKAGHAEDDTGRSSLSVVGNSLLGIVGLSKEEEQDKIEYRERPPLVVPPKIDLPPPAKPIAKSNPAWPVDQEMARKKKKQDEARVVRDEDQFHMTDEERYRRVNPDKPFTPSNNCAGDDFGRICDQQSFWDSLKTKKAEEPVLQPGQEPDREYLTQPPKGYMAARKVMKPTFEVIDKSIDPLDPREQIRQEQRRKEGLDD